MSKRPWVPVYVGDLLADTMNFTSEQFGGYMKILFHYWVTEEPMTKEEMRSASGLSNHIFQKSWGVLSKKFTEENGKYFNRRMRREITKATDLSNKRSVAGSKAHPAIAHDMPVLKPTQLQLQSQLQEKDQEPWSNGFDRWWDVWPKKSKKAPAKKIWKRIKPNADILIADVKKRLANDRKWNPNKDGETFIPDPTTYLNQERWNDEIQQVILKKSTAPRNDDGLEQFAIDNKLHERGKAPQHLKNAYQYRQWIEAKLKERI